MSHNALVFSGNHLVEAHYAALDPISDIVVVRNVVSTTNDFLVDRYNAVQRFRALTPRMEEWWRRRQTMRGEDFAGPLEFLSRGLNVANVAPHIDHKLLSVGYVASVNLGDTPRSVYATRQDMPCFVDEEGVIGSAMADFREHDIPRRILPAEDWIVLNPGDAALWGALPNLALHSVEGETQQAVLTLWQPTSQKVLQ